MPERADAGSPQGTSSPADEDEVSLLDLLIVLAKHKRIVLGVPFVTAIAAAVISLFMSNVYTATTQILPPQRSALAGSALLNQLGGALGSFGALAGGALGVGN